MKSYSRSRSWDEFILKRFRRIYPAYFVIVVLCAVLGCLITTYTWSAYFTSRDVYSYLAANLIFLNFIQPTLPGVFDTNAFAAINGSLWTLKIEVAYYLLVPLIVVLRKKMNIHILYSFLFIASSAYYLLLLRLYGSTNNDTYLFLSRQIPGQLFYFILGAWVIEFETKSWWRELMKWLGIPGLIVLLLPLPVPMILQTLLMTVSIFFCAYIVPAIQFKYREQDVSYGLYIYHFPVIQLLVYLNVFKMSAYLGLLVSLSITLILAILSWRFIEKPAIKKNIKQSLALS